MKGTKELIGERLKVVLHHYNLRSTLLSEKMGKSRTLIGNYTNGNSYPPIEFLLQLEEELPLLNLNWLITGKGEMLLNDKPQIDPEELTTLKNELEELKAERRNLISSLGAMSQSFSTRINTNLAKLKAVCKTAGMKHKLTFDELLMLNATPVHTVGLH